MRKPTPSEIARYVTEDQYGLPMITAQPGYTPDAYNAGPDFDVGGGPETEEEGCTQMKQCDASACIHNQAGHCELETIEINQHGGCAQYEATAGEEDMIDDEAGRYDEESSDVTGMPQREPQNDMGNRWKPGGWDARGGGY